MLKADKVVLPWAKLQDIVHFGVDNNSVVQDFMPPFHSKCASIMRYVYYNPLYKSSNELNHAFLL